MNSSSPVHPADAADRHASLLGMALLMIALKFAASAGLHFVDGSTAAVLDKVELVLALGAAALALWIVVWKALRLSPQQRRAYFRTDSFASEALRQARVASWNLTFLTLVILEIFADDVTSVGPDFYVQVALAVLLGAFGLKFFVLMRDTPGEDDV